MKVSHIATLGAAAVIATTGVVVLPSISADAASSSGKVSFLVAEQQSGGTKGNATAILHGAINAGGKDNENNGDYDEITLPGGSLRVIHPDKDSTFKYKPNAKTCYFTVTGKGTYTLGHGTGKYKGVTGSGHYTLVASGYSAKKNGSCNFQGNAGTFAGYVKGSGPVTLP